MKSAPLSPSAPDRHLSVFIDAAPAVSDGRSFIVTMIDGSAGRFVLYSGSSYVEANRVAGEYLRPGVRITDRSGGAP